MKQRVVEVTCKFKNRKNQYDGFDPDRENDFPPFNAL